MAEKKKNAKMANRNVGVETIKDDGDKYVVLRNGAQVYSGKGVALAEAVRLATSLQEGAGIAKVEGDAVDARHRRREQRVRRLPGGLTGFEPASRQGGRQLSPEPAAPRSGTHRRSRSTSWPGGAVTGSPAR